ncbi:MAG: hypothetical protein ACP5N0_03420 [Methanosarcina sp.]|uniref:hypothetical protein n=1 Tax=Methanosarcina sp. TaxID=2213 RepID=UPI003BB744C2
MGLRTSEEMINQANLTAEEFQTIEEEAVSDFEFSLKANIWYTIKTAMEDLKEYGVKDVKVEFALKIDGVTFSEGVLGNEIIQIDNTD